MSNQRIRPAAAVSVLMMMVFGAALASAAPGNPFQMLIDEMSPAMVTVKYVLKDQAGNRQPETEVTGVMVSGDGLVLMANTRIGGNPLTGTSQQPVDIKVLLGDDEEGLDAIVVARDQELDLAWIQIVEELESPADHLDLEAAGMPSVGETVYSLRLLDKYFDRRPVVAQGPVCGQVTKPRDLYLPAVQVNPEPGMPIFQADGKLVGVVIVQVPDLEARQASGQQMRLRDVFFILPAERVMKQTRMAAELAVEKREEAQEAAAEEAADAAAAEAAAAEEAATAGGEASGE